VQRPCRSDQAGDCRTAESILRPCGSLLASHFGNARATVYGLDNSCGRCARISPGNNRVPIVTVRSKQAFQRVVARAALLRRYLDSRRTHRVPVSAAPFVLLRVSISAMRVSPAPIKRRGRPPGTKNKPAAGGPKKRRGMSAAARKRIAEATRKRWAAAKKSGKKRL
jgi:hypothetical protein